MAAITLLHFGENEVKIAGEIRVRLRQKNSPIGAYDLLIAATAITHHLVAVTANGKEFEQIPELSVMNWRKPATQVA